MRIFIHELLPRRVTQWQVQNTDHLLVCRVFIKIPQQCSNAGRLLRRLTCQLRNRDGIFCHHGNLKQIEPLVPIHRRVRGRIHPEHWQSRKMWRWRWRRWLWRIFGSQRHVDVELSKIVKTIEGWMWMMNNWVWRELAFKLRLERNEA